MALAQKPYYWIVCDEPGCGVKSTENAEHSAWYDVGQAYDDAIDGEWSCTKLGDFCFEHSLNRCRECGKRLTLDEIAEGEETCSVCDH